MPTDEQILAILARWAERDRATVGGDDAKKNDDEALQAIRDLFAA